MKCERILKGFINAKTVHVYEPFCEPIKELVHNCWAHHKLVRKQNWPHDQSVEPMIRKRAGRVIHGVRWNNFLWTNQCKRHRSLSGKICWFSWKLTRKDSFQHKCHLSYLVPRSFKPNQFVPLGKCTNANPQWTKSLSFMWSLCYHFV